jgi:hypothetical protein
MREESSATVAELTGCQIVMLSANHLDLDLGAETYVLDQPPDQNARTRRASLRSPDTTGHPSS